MDNDERSRWAERFSVVNQKITQLIYELSNTNDITEFNSEMEKHIKRMEEELSKFKEAAKYT